MENSNETTERIFGGFSRAVSENIVAEITKKTIADFFKYPWGIHGEIPAGILEDISSAILASISRESHQIFLEAN